VDLSSAERQAKRSLARQCVQTNKSGAAMAAPFLFLSKID
jgi:hypothetical protein